MTNTRIETTDLARDALYTKVNQIADEKIDLDSLSTSTDLRDSIRFYAWKGGTISSSTFVPTTNANYYTTNLTLSVGDKFYSDTTPIVYLGVIDSVEESSEVSGVYIITLSNGDEYTLKYNNFSSSETNSFDFLVPSQRAVKHYIDDGFVTSSTTQTITGAKTFTADIKVSKTSPKLDLYNTNLTKGTTPSTLQYSRNAMLDKDGKFIGMTQYQYNTQGSTTVALRAYSPNNETNYAQIVVVYPASGSAYTYAPAPTDTTTTSGTQIATTGWVNTVGNNVVHLTGSETVTGAKTFTDNITISKTTPSQNIKNTAVTTGTSASNDQPYWIRFTDSNDRTIAAVRGAYSTSKSAVAALRAVKSNASSDTNSTELRVLYPASGDPYAVSPEFRPSADNSNNLGNSSYRWKQLYAGTSTIATSDERVKQNIESIPDEVLDVWGEVDFYQFKFKDSVAEKGLENARLHTGVIAQRIKTIFENHNLDATKYGLLCYDEWEAQPAEIDENGDIVTPARAAGNIYSIRYEECLCMEAAYQRRRADRIEERLRRLEERL